MNGSRFPAIRKIGLLLLTAVLCIGGTLSPARSLQAAPICIDDLCFEVPTTVDYLWTAHAADFDGNGLTDLYVRGGYMTYANEFIVSQTSALQFTLVVPTAQQRQAVRSVPKSDVTVYREELNNDGFLDFWLEHVDEVIPGAPPDLLILTAFGLGTTPETIIPLPHDGELDVLMDNIEFTLDNIQEVMDLYNGTTCVIWTILVPYQEWDPFYDMYVIRWIPYSFEECYPNRDHPIFSGDLGVFCGGMSNYLVANGGEAGARQAAVDAAQNGQVIRDRVIRPAVERIPGQVISQTARRAAARRAAVRVAIVLVSAAASPAVIAVISAAALAWTLYEVYDFYQESAAQSARARAKKRDALVVPGTVPAASYNEGTDPYRKKDTCKPWDNVAAQTPAPTVNDGDSTRLRDNLKLAGCECPPGTEAHHIFKKRGGDDAGDSLRACLDAAGINMDWAGNGICLPTSESDPFIASGRTRIASHQGSGVHRYEHYSGIARECEARTMNLTTQAQKEAAVRQLLDELRHGYHNWRVLQ